MNEMFSLFFFTNLAFGFITLILVFREEERKHHFSAQKKDLAGKMLEVTVIRGLARHVGRELSIAQLGEAIAKSIEEVLPASVVTCGALEKGAIIVRTYVRKPVGKAYVHKASEIVLSALRLLDRHARDYAVIEDIVGTINDRDTKLPRSFFNIPLVINGNVLGMISISSKETQRFEEQDMSLLYAVVANAAKVVEGFSLLVEGETGKLTTMLSNISLGAVLFVLEEGKLRLSMINETAKFFLGLYSYPTTEDVLTGLRNKFGLSLDTDQIVATKKPFVPQYVEHFGVKYKVFLNPVFLQNSNRLVGISVTLEDVTLEAHVEKVKENFAHLVVHELRAPLQSVKGASELLRSGKLSSSDQQRMIGMIAQSVDRLLTDVGNLLDMAKFQTGRFSVVKTMGNINQLIQERVEIFDYLAKTKQIELVFSLSPDIPEFEFDQGRVGQVFNNLLSNSIKFTNSGGRIMVQSIMTKNPDTGQEIVRVAVTDSGMGIPADKMKYVFSKFSQFSSVPEGGTGLGLYISKAIIESHGGKIWIESPAHSFGSTSGVVGAEQHSGTTVYFTLPVTVSPHQETGIPLLEHPHLESPTQAVPLAGRVVN